MAPILDPKLLLLLPSQHNLWRVDWRKIDSTILLKLFPQGILYVGGSSKRRYDHPLSPRFRTEALSRMPEFRALPTAQRLELFLASLLLDVAKVEAPRDAQLNSTYFSNTSSSLARQFLFEQFDMGGSAFLQNIRETVAFLVKYQNLPLRLPKLPTSDVIMRRISSNAYLAPDYSFDLQCILYEACIQSTRGPFVSTMRSALPESKSLAKSLGCYEYPLEFPSGRELFITCNGDGDVREGEAVEGGQWGEVILLCALPSTGKDQYCAMRWGDLPVIIPDDIRKEKGVVPGMDISSVLGAAQEMASEYLAHHQSFVWNAPSLGHKMRSQLVDLFHREGASVRIVFLEASWSEILRRNSHRTDPIPEHILHNMLGRLDFPERCEAEEVEWVIYQDADVLPD